MSNQDINTKAQELRELKRMQEELAAEIAAIENEIKQHMELNALDTITTNEYKITWKAVSSSRLDTAAIKRDYPDIAERYTKVTTSRRFLVN